MEKLTQLSTEFGQASAPAASDDEPRASVSEDGKLKRLNQLIEGCSIAGLMHATSASNRAARVFWTILLLCGVVGFSANLSSLIQEYLRKPILTEMSHDYDNYYWPDISFCNPTSPIPFSMMNESLSRKWENLKKKGMQVQKEACSFRNFSMEELLMSSINHKEFHTAELRHMIKGICIAVESNHLPEHSGYFNRQTNVEIDVNKENWFLYRWIPMPTPVNCYTFKMHDFYKSYKQQTSKGNIVGLHMFMELNLEDFQRFNTAHHLRGINVFITNPNHSLLSSRYSHVGTGISVKFEIAQSMMKRIHKGNHCRLKDYKMRLYNPTFTKTYEIEGNFKDCKYVTAQEFYLNNCYCYNPALPIIDHNSTIPHPLCLNMTHFNISQLLRNMNCMDRVKAEIRSLENNTKVKILNKCFQYQSPACNERVYTVDQNEYHWPRVMTDVIKQQVLGFMTIKEDKSTDWVTTFRNNYLIIDFVTEGDYVRVIKEEYEYPFSKLLSDIGGIMGLWIGINIVSIFELLEIFHLFVIFLKRKIWSI